MKTIIFFIFTVPLASAGTHSLKYFLTGVTPGINCPEFSGVGLMDGEQFGYYDSNISKAIPETGWTMKITADDPDHLKANTQYALRFQEKFKVDMNTLMKSFNQTTGVHTWQRMQGCELHEDGTRTGYIKYGYDGEDFLSFDLNTLTYVAANPQAFPTKHKWESSASMTLRRKNYLEYQCIEWLQKYVEYGKATLERKVPPEVSVFQADSSSPVVCHATGFFPKDVMISWQKNGEDVEEEVELRETLRNQDGSFQKRSILTVSSEKLDTDQYTCVVQHEGLEMNMVLKTKDRRVLSEGGGMDGIIVGAVVAVLLLINIGISVGYFIWKKSDFKPVNQTASDADSGEKA